MTNIGEAVEKQEPLYIADENVKWCSQCGKQFGSSSNKLYTKLPYDLAISILGIFQKIVHTKTLYLNVHSNTIYNTQKVETTQMSINRQVSEQIVV